MIQNRNKLSEVGLEPDKPKGHIRAVWALTLILAFAIVIGGGVYFILWCSPWGENVSVNKSTTTSTLSSSVSPSGSPINSPKLSYQTYTESSRSSFSFEYPKDWQILKSNPYDADAEKMELVYESGNVLNTSLVVIEDHSNVTGATDVRQAAKDMLPAANFVTDTTLGGKPAIKASGDEGMPPRTRYFALNNGYLIIVIGENFEGNNNLTVVQQKNKSAFEHIISSWKWL
ncbi:MAG: hypothetical protein CEN92_431 [Candidatus Berkelbacteria bacterium Licking1014_96]|uniref:Uncharacterized protein n=1 Tax=Candidatus Berkelbacteria bacterium Licking1014_96 TaxID=2017149 RepID=A0A554LCM8_9BACT|nr:MAG: hypothetical protein CEN92_431 [Candidatus Berkelbacteria bacterium Licking1014_96]